MGTACCRRDACCRLVTQSAEELKEQERAHNRAAAAEAAMRKERRRVAQEKKKQKAQQRAELLPAQVSRAATGGHETCMHSVAEEPGGSALVVQAIREEAAEELCGPETPPAEEVSLKAEPVPQGLSSAAPGEEEGKLKGKSKPVNFKARANPRARPFAARKSTYGTLKTYGRQLYNAAEEHPIAVGASGLAAAVILALAPLMYFYR